MNLSKPNPHCRIKFRPLGNRIIAGPVPRGPTPAGVIYSINPFPNDCREYWVLAVGPGKLKKDGTREPIPLLPGFRVIVPYRMGQQFEIDGKPHYVFNFEELLAVLPT